MDRVVLLGLVMAACTTTPAATPPPATVEPVAEAPAAEPEPELEPEPEPEPEVKVEGYEAVASILGQRSVWWRLADARIALKHRGAVRTSADGADLGVADGQPFPDPQWLMVIDPAAERPRVVVDERTVRLLLMADRVDAHPVVLARAPLRPKSSFEFRDPPRRGHAVLLPGALVEIESKEEAGVQVRYAKEKRSLAGWVDAEAIGTVVEIREPPEDEREGFLAKRNTALLARPGGKILARIEKDEDVVALTPRVSSGHRLVEYQPHCQSDVSYVGYVSSRTLYQPNYGMGYGCGSGTAKLERPWGDAESAPRVTVAAGRFLLDVERPAVVGCVREATEFADLGDGVHAIATRWGPIPVRLAPESFRGPCGTESPQR